MTRAIVPSRRADSGPVVPFSRSLLSVGPVVVLLTWFFAGQWELAGEEARAWLRLATASFLASVIPLPGSPQSSWNVRLKVMWWGWVVVVGLMVTL